MMDTIKQSIMNQYNREAFRYDSSKACQFALSSYPYVFNTLMPIKFDSILDIGCGTGTLLRKVLNERPQVKACGLDLSQEMLNIARGKLPKRVQLTWGEAEVLPYSDQMFDIVIIVDSLRFFENPERAVKESYRVLKPGGKLIICDMLTLGILRLIGERKMLSEARVREALSKAGFNLITFMRNIPSGYIATGDKR